MKKIFALVAIGLMAYGLKAQEAYPAYYPCRAANGLWGYVDDNERWTIQPKYTAVLYETNGGMYPVSKDGKWGFVGVNGLPLTEIIYDACMCEIDYPENNYRVNYAAVRRKGKWAFINVQGVFVTDFKYDEVLIYNGKYVIRNREGKDMKQGYLDDNAQEVWEN